MVTDLEDLARPAKSLVYDTLFNADPPEPLRIEDLTVTPVPAAFPCHSPQGLADRVLALGLEAIVYQHGAGVAEGGPRLMFRPGTLAADRIAVERLLGALPDHGRAALATAAGTGGRQVATHDEYRNVALAVMGMPAMRVTVGYTAIPAPDGGGGGGVGGGFGLDDGGLDDGGLDDGGLDDGAPEPFDALGFLAAHVAPLCQSNRRRFWGALYALVAEEHCEAPPDYDRTAWAMEHASEGLMMSALARTVPLASLD